MEIHTNVRLVYW